MRRFLACCGLVLLVGCGPRTVRRTHNDPAALLETARARRIPFALQGRFAVTLSGPDLSASTNGGLIVHRPDRFRVEILTPLATPLILMASDGQSLHAFTSADRDFYRGDDAVAVLAELTGGAVALADVVSVLTGTLPMAGADVTSLTENQGGGAVVGLRVAPLPSGDEVLVRADLDPDGLVRTVSVERNLPGEAPLVVLEVETLDTMRVGRSRLPEELQVRLPTLGWTVDLEFSAWDELGQIPDVFSLQPPPGSNEKDLVTTLRDLAERRRARGG
jgi:outer membrane biogenesis lipoprotein LolB